MKRPPRRPPRSKGSLRLLRKKIPKPVSFDLYKMALQLGNAPIASPTFWRVILEARRNKIEVTSMGEMLRKLKYSREDAIKIFRQHYIELFTAGRIRPNITLIRKLAQSDVRTQYDKRPPKKRN